MPTRCSAPPRCPGLTRPACRSPSPPPAAPARAGLPAPPAAPAGGPGARAAADAGEAAGPFGPARTPRGGAPPAAAVIARPVLANPAYAVRYAYAAAAAVLRWAAALGT